MQNKQAHNDLLRGWNGKEFLENAVLEFAFPIIVSSFLALVTFLYLRGWLRLRVTLPHLVSFAKVAAFLTGILLVWLVVASPIAHLDHELLSIHMVQHLLLMAVAAPLLLLGAPAPLLLHSLPKSLFSGVAGRLLEGDWLHRLGDIFSHSTFCWLAGTMTVIGWHVPAVFDLGLHSIRWHEIEHATFFLAGLLFWWPVIQPRPGASRWSIPLYLFLATLPCDTLSAYLVFCDHVVYRSYEFVPRLLGISALQDQQWAGALMWVTVTFIYVVPAVAVILHLLSGAAGRTPVFNATINELPKAN